MIVKVSKYGEILASRPEGREAALTLLAAELRDDKSSVQINFEEVLVMTPSWLSEFVQTLKEKGVKKVSYLSSENASVNESIKFVDLEFDHFGSST